MTFFKGLKIITVRPCARVKTCNYITVLLSNGIHYPLRVAKVIYIDQLIYIFYPSRFHFEKSLQELQEERFGNVEALRNAFCYVNQFSQQLFFANLKILYFLRILLQKLTFWELFTWINFHKQINLEIFSRVFFLANIEI